ncbi:MAG: metallophosphoesterase, partial [Thermoleophilia bacterium]
MLSKHRPVQAGLCITILSVLLLWAAPAYGVQARNVAVSNVVSGSAVLVVKSDVTADVSVDYGSSSGIYTLAKTSNGRVRHEIILDTMAPGSTVYYRVTITDSTNPAASTILPEKSFHLARGAGEPFSFSVGGDNRPWTDTTVQPAVWTTIVQQMASENLDLSLNVGDMIYGTFYDSMAQNIAKYDGFFSVTSPLTASVPMYTAVGNHESIATASNRAGYEQEFTLPVNNGADAATYGEEYYSFVNGDTRFISLCTELPGQEGMITGNQLAWLQQVLAANTSKWAVVFMHRPLFAGVHTTDPWMNTGNIAGQQNRWELHNLFRQYGVDVVFEGHEHYYHHHVEDGVQYVITGGGGSPLMIQPAPQTGDIFSWSGYEHVKVDETSASLKVSAIDSTGVTR